MALPQTINTATPASSDSPSGAPALFQNIKQFLVDVFGITDNTAYNVKAMTVDPTTGVVSIQVAGFTTKGTVIAQGTITDPALGLSGTVTWNDVNDTFTAWKLDVTDTNSAAASLLLDLRVGGNTKMSVSKAGVLTVASTINPTGVFLGPAGTNGAPTYSFVGDPDTGLYDSAADQVSLTNGGTERHRFAAAQYSLLHDSAILALGASSDALLVRDAANTLALKNGTTAQTLYIYGTTTGPKRMKLSHSGTVGVIDNSTDDIQIGASGGTVIVHSSGTNSFYPGADNSVDLGVTGTNRFRNIFITGSIATVGTITSGIWNGGIIGALYGGTGLNTSASSGIPSISAGTWSIVAQISALRGGTGIDGSAAANGTLLIGNGTGYTLTTLTAGKGIEVTNASGSVTVEQWSPENKELFYDDFNAWDSAATGTNIHARGEHPWELQGNPFINTASGDGTKTSLHVNSNGAVQGYVYLANGFGGSFSRIVAASRNPDFRVRFAQTGSAAGTRRVGLNANPNGAGDPNDGVYFRWTVGGTISLVSRASGVESTLSTGITAADLSHNKYRVVFNGTTSLTLYVDGSQVGTISSNIPSAGLVPWGEGGSTTNANGFAIDYFWIMQAR